MMFFEIGFIIALLSLALLIFSGFLHLEDYLAPDTADTAQVLGFRSFILGLIFMIVGSLQFML